MKAALATLATLVVLAAIVLGGWAAGWWFRAQDVNREYQVNTHSQGYVAAQIDHLRDLAQGYHATTDPAQRAQVASEFCAIEVDLQQAPPNDIADDASAMCH